MELLTESHVCTDLITAVHITVYKVIEELLASTLGIHRTNFAFRYGCMCLFGNAVLVEEFASLVFRLLVTLDGLGWVSITSLLLKALKRLALVCRTAVDFVLELFQVLLEVLNDLTTLGCLIS